MLLSVNQPLTCCIFIAKHCHVLQRDAACCSVLLGIAVCCRSSLVDQPLTCFSALQYCSVLQCDALC